MIAPESQIENKSMFSIHLHKHFKIMSTHCESDNDIESLKSDAFVPLTGTRSQTEKKHNDPPNKNVKLPTDIILLRHHSIHESDTRKNNLIETRVQLSH